MPTVEGTGLGARLSGHFGSAPYFTVVESDTGRTQVIENAHARHEHGQCRPTRSLEGLGVEAVVCRGLGRRALSVLSGEGITVLVTEAATVAEAMKAFGAGRAIPLDEAHACQGGHSHRHS
jgi:predicted Fe-Mo cluster-binding NifX family protein